MVDDILNKFLRALRWSQISLGDRSTNVGQHIERELSHDLILALRLDAHIAIVEALDHRDGDVEHDVREEHRGHHELNP